MLKITFQKASSTNVSSTASFSNMRELVTFMEAFIELPEDMLDELVEGSGTVEFLGVTIIAHKPFLV